MPCRHDIAHRSDHLHLPTLDFAQRHLLGPLTVSKASHSLQFFKPPTSTPSSPPLSIPIMSPPWKVTFSSDFYLASGTITVDLPARKVLIIYDLTSKTYYLPRGRKDWSEPLEATAIRETYEEAGCTATLLPVPLSTRCTPPSSTSTHNPQLQKARFDPSGDVLLPNTARLTEPIALMQHPQKKNGALAIVLWYVAIGDSTLPLAKETQMSDEQFEALWVGFEDGPGMMVNHAYGQVLQRGIDLALAASQMDDMDVGMNAAVACQDPPQKDSHLSSPKTSEAGSLGVVEASRTETPPSRPEMPLSPPNSL
ncbi:hypothetical protein QC762_504645 [Podospora pseudocomata]|uniref:Nudix hydrolase domain-containing protein n=1 Tax=Podospora pseudocomata TaxID=2093779 RepID=A0ABR0GBH4_9PEZI|nr:hypothetical protein QC762_504645 [Podospora pseudocomata]